MKNFSNNICTEFSNRGEMVDSVWTGKTIRLDQWSQHREANDMTSALVKAFRGAIIDAKKIGKVKSITDYDVVVGNMQRVAPLNSQHGSGSINVDVSVKQSQLGTFSTFRLVEDFKQTMAKMRSDLIKDQLLKEDIGPCSVGLVPHNPSSLSLEATFRCSLPEWFCYPKNKNLKSSTHEFNHVNLVCNVTLRECRRVIEFVCSLNKIKPSPGGVFVTTSLPEKTSRGVVDLDMPAAVWIQYKSMAEQKAAKGVLDQSRQHLPQSSLVFSIDHRQACILRLQKILIGCSVHRRCKTMQRFCPWLCILSPDPCCGGNVGQLSACNNPRHYCKNANKVGLSLQIDDIVQNTQGLHCGPINRTTLGNFLQDFYELILKLSSSGVDGKSAVKGDDLCITRMKGGDFTTAYSTGKPSSSSAVVAYWQVPPFLHILTYVGSMFADFHSSQHTERLTAAILAQGLSNHGSDESELNYLPQVADKELSIESMLDSDKTPSTSLKVSGAKHLPLEHTRDSKKQKVFGKDRTQIIHNCSFCKNFKSASYDLVCHHELICPFNNDSRH